MWAASALATKFPTSLDCQSLKAGLVLGCAGVCKEKFFAPLASICSILFWPFSVGKALIRLLPCVNWTHTDQNQSEVGHSLRSHRHGRPRTFQVQSRSSQTLLVCLLACLFICLFIYTYVYVYLLIDRLIDCNLLTSSAGVWRFPWQPQGVQ